MDDSSLNAVSERIIGAAIEVHRALGPGLLESAYQACLCQELSGGGFPIESEVDLPVVYKGTRLSHGYRLDLVVDRRVVVEVKSVKGLEDIHTAQVLTYLRLGGYPLGLLINFNVPRLVEGLRRLKL